jgi:hypothetical protein
LSVADGLLVLVLVLLLLVLPGDARWYRDDSSRVEDVVSSPLLLLLFVEVVQHRVDEVPLRHATATSKKGNGRRRRRGHQGGKQKIISNWM